MPNGRFYHNSFDRFIFSQGVSGLFLGILLIIQIPLLNANSVDPDQMSCSFIHFGTPGLSGLRVMMLLLWKIIANNNLSIQSKAVK